MSLIHRTLHVVFSSVLLLFSVTASATTLEQQRALYTKAKTAFKHNDREIFNEAYQALGDYPLKPYLDYALATKALDPLNSNTVETFIHQHKQTYLGDRLYRRYLHKLAAKHAWRDLLFWYRPELASEGLNCQWLQARHQQGDHDALNAVEDIWLQAKSISKACDELIAVWRNSDYYKDSATWKRFMLALTHSNRGLARYLASELHDSYQTYVKQAWELDQRPHRISRHKRFSKQTPETQDLIHFGIKKYAKRHSDQAYKHWQHYKSQNIFDEDVIRDIELTLIKRSLHHKRVDKAQALIAQAPHLHQPEIIEQLIRELLKEARWQDVNIAIALLPPHYQQKDRWRYWHARTQAELDASFDTKPTYQALAKKRSYYGFLAADKIDAGYALQHEQTDIERQALARIANIPAINRAKELWLTGHLSEAYAEWSYGIAKLSAKELAIAGRLANQWGWHDSAIRTMIAGEHWHRLDDRFPLAFKKHIHKAATNTRMPAALIYAIARQESALAPQAVSPAGAHGLMQLLPSTARQTARKYGIDYKTSKDLSQPQSNIKLGSTYLRELLDQYEGNRILATAAYNAGPHRVNRWLRESADHMTDFDVWIETIPFKETRRYVKNVLTYSVIYSYRMGENGNLISELEAKRKL